MFSRRILGFTVQYTNILAVMAGQKWAIDQLRVSAKEFINA